jgi:hypothetical protein
MPYAAHDLPNIKRYDIVKSMNGESTNGGRRHASLIALILVALAMSCLEFGKKALAQEPSQQSGQELVANLAAGRVIIAVVKDAIVVGTLENPIEPETRPPTPVEIETSRLGVILGSVDWFSPSTQQDVARLDNELPRLRSHVATVAPHLAKSQGGDEASDIESTGLGLHERLNEVAKGLHGKVALPENEPLAQLIVADYLGGYGPEVWQLTYEMKQVEEKEGYWETRVLKPSYLQFWPPEKGQPKNLMEFDYPPGAPAPSLQTLIRQRDSQLQKVMSDPQMLIAANQLAEGDSTTLSSADAIPVIRASLDAIKSPKARETIAVIMKERGFAWVVPPSAEPERPKPVQPVQAASQGDRPADAPSLLKH